MYDGFNCQKAATGPDLSREQLCMKLVTRSLEICSLPCPRGLGVLQSAVQALLLRDSRREQAQRSESSVMEQMRSGEKTTVLSLSS